MADVKKNSMPVFYVLLINSTDHISEKTGVVALLSAFVSKNGGAPVSLSSPGDYSWTELSAIDLPGLYAFQLNSANSTDTSGECVIYIKATGADIFKKVFNVVDWTLQDMVKLAKNRRKVTANQLVIYDDNGITPLFTFDLKDSSALPSMTSIFERTPV